MSYWEETLLEFNSVLSNYDSSYNLDEKVRIFPLLIVRSCDLLSSYLAYQGLYQFDKLEILKEAYHCGLINDGEAWVDALAIVDIIKLKKQASFRFVIENFINNKSSIFYDLKDFFNGIME